MEEMCSVTSTDAATVAGLNRNTMAGWQYCGVIPRSEGRGYTPADCMSLSLASDLVGMGLVAEAAAVAYGVLTDWQRVIASSQRVLLLARREDDGRWAFAVCPKDEIPVPSIHGTIQVDLTHIAKRTLARLRELQGA